MAEFLRDPQNSGISSINGLGEAEEPIQGHLAVDSSSSHLYSEVLKEFTRLYFSTTPEDYDEELLDAYLEEMDRLSPMEGSFESQASLEEFHERFSSLFETQEEASPQERPRHQVIRLPVKIRKLWIVAAIIIGIFGMLVTAHAVGIDVLRTIGRWTEETFHFESRPMGCEQETAAESVLSYSECRELLYVALEECGIEEDLVPKWCPERFKASEPINLKKSQSNVIYVPFQDEEANFFSLTITFYQTPEDVDYLTFEKDNSFVEQYTVDSMLFYILSNNDTITAAWSDGLLVEKIMGNLTMEEIKTIINSIGGTN